MARREPNETGPAHGARPSARRSSAWTWSSLRFGLPRPSDLLLRAIGSSYRTFLWAFQRLSPSYLERASRKRALRARAHALATVPAYRRHVLEHGAPDALGPETDKESYVKRHPVEARCVRGILPLEGTRIDESSGSTGTPFDWVRSTRELLQSRRFISFFARYSFGAAPRITINAFTMGAWATGHNMGLALQGTGIVKDTGPDVEKILHTLEFFGTGYRYLIMGYPPFLKHLIDTAERRGFPLPSYRLDGLVGGEGMSEGLRDYLLRRFLKVYSGYGATDLEIGLAGETPLSVAIRRLALRDEKARRALFGEDSRLPMLFQYNPMMHHVEVNERRELVVTITRLSILSPRIRYNVHDEGGIARYDRMAERLAALGHDVDTLLGADAKAPRLELPFLWVYGRSDSTLSVMGANIYPEDVEACLYAIPELARVTRSYCLSLAEAESGEVRPCFSFETDEPFTAGRELTQRILDELIGLNADFREAWKEHPAVLVPEIRLYGNGEGPFSRDAARIKQVRVVGGSRAPTPTRRHRAPGGSPASPEGGTSLP
jgi:phenylacetate-CoA ligase